MEGIVKKNQVFLKINQQFAESEPSCKSNIFYPLAKQFESKSKFKATGCKKDGFFVHYVPKLKGEWQV